jgi:RNA polymerase sigma factor (sigma-70 family)
VVEPDQTAVAQAVTSLTPGILPRPAPDGYEEFFREAFREAIRAAMYAGATLEEAKDAAAEALTRMLLHWERIRRRKGPLAYARKAAVHHFINATTRGPDRTARRMVERGHVSRQEGAEDSELTRREDEEWVADMLSSLPPAQREVMELFVEGLDLDEIAAVLGKTKEAVRQNLCYARRRLRELIANGEQRQAPPGQHRKQTRSERQALPGRRPDDHQ